jgi:hypothetical protein
MGTPGPPFRGNNGHPRWEVWRMSGKVHYLPRDHFRHQLPADAKPNGRERDVSIHPAPDGWGVWQSDDGGGCCLGAGLSKAEALRIASEFVLKWNATMSLSNEGW